MKKLAIYLIAASAFCAMALTGCGAAQDDGTPVPTATATAAPGNRIPGEEGLLPDMEMPEVKDGIVEDRDGVITETDNAADQPGRGEDADDGRMNGTGTSTGNSTGADSGRTAGSGAGKRTVNWP